MKKTILTISVIAGLACGNAIATPAGVIQNALSTCQSTSSCPTPTGMLFNKEIDARNFLRITGMMGDVYQVTIGTASFFVLTPVSPSP